MDSGAKAGIILTRCLKDVYFYIDNTASIIAFVKPTL